MCSCWNRVVVVSDTMQGGIAHALGGSFAPGPWQDAALGSAPVPRPVFALPIRQRGPTAPPLSARRQPGAPVLPRPRAGARRSVPRAAGALLRQVGPAGGG